MTAVPLLNDPARSGVARWFALGVLMLALAMALFDVTIVNLTLPSVRQGLGASEATLSWVVAGYVLAYALSLVPAGRLGDRYGHKWIFIAGVSLYVLSGLAGALSDDQLHLVIARVLHGLSGGIMISPITALIQILFQGASRVRAFGFFAATTGIASLIGPLLGGWAIDLAGLEQGWRYAMCVGLPLGVVAVLLAFPLLPVTKCELKGRFDVLGMVLFSAAVLGFLTPMIQTNAGHLPAWGWMSIAAAVVLMIVFVLWERRLERVNAFPVFPISLFRHLSFSLGLATTFVAFASFTSAIFISFSVLWQSGRGESALAAALVTLPFGLGVIIGALLEEKLSHLLRRWVVPAALAVLVAGFLITYVMLVTVPFVPGAWLAVPLFAAGIGSGSFIGLNMSSTLSAVPEPDAGAASGMLMTFQRVGAALGTAIVVILVSQPGPGGGFDAPTMIKNGTIGILACTLLAAVAMLVSLIITTSSRQSYTDHSLKEEPREETSAA